jgi:hypothetical protein
MYALINNFPGKPQPAPVALAGPCPHQRWGGPNRSNPMTLAESPVR